MKRSIDDPQGYLERIKPIYTRLFRMAHAIIGNLELAEYVLKASIVEAYLRRNEWRDRMAFKEGLMHTVRTVALVELRNMRSAGAFEIDWTPIVATTAGEAPGLLAMRLEREPADLVRLAILFYGCDCAIKQIAGILQISHAEASGRLRKLNARLSRAVRARSRDGGARLEEQMEALCLAALDQPGADVPEMGRVFRSFERDVDGARKPRRSFSWVLAAILKCVLAVVLAAAIWFMAVLLEPTSRATVSASDEMIEAAGET